MFQKHKGAVQPGAVQEDQEPGRRPGFVSEERTGVCVFQKNGKKEEQVLFKKTTLLVVSC